MEAEDYRTSVLLLIINGIVWNLGILFFPFCRPYFRNNSINNVSYRYKLHMVIAPLKILATRIFHSFNCVSIIG